MGAKPKFFFVAPKDGVALGDAFTFGHVGGAVEDLVEVGDLVFAMIANEEEEGAGVGLDGVAEEGADSFVELFADHVNAGFVDQDFMMCSFDVSNLLSV